MNKQLPSSAPSNKLLHLESIRGLAALSVVFSHLVNMFCQQLMAVDAPTRQAHPAWMTVIACSPLNLAYNGHFAVVLFFVLSGFVLSYSFLRSGNQAALTSAAIRRYSRLMIPILVSTLLIYALSALGLLYNQQAAALMSDESWIGTHNRFGLGFLAAVREGAYGALLDFDPANTCNAALWTMSIELLGSFFVFAFLALFGRLQRRWLVYLAMSAVLLLIKKPFIFDFLAGLVLCDYYVQHEKAQGRRRPPRGFFLAGMLVLGLFLGAQQGDALLLPGISVHVRAMTLVNSIGVLLVLVAVLWSTKLKMVLHTRPCVFLGAMSFPLYLTHLAIICSVGCFVYVRLRLQTGCSQTAAAWITSASVTCVCLVVAWILHLAVDRPAIGFGKWVERRLLGPVGANTAAARAG